MDAFERKAVNSRPIHWSWTHFYTNHEKHGNNSSDVKSVWCKACVRKQMGASQEIHLLANGIAGTVSDVDLFKTAISLIPPKAGKPVHDMLPHLTSCNNLEDSSIKQQAQAELQSAKQNRLMKATKENIPFLSTHFQSSPSLTRTLSLPSLPSPGPGPSPFRSPVPSRTMASLFDNNFDNSPRPTKRNKMTASNTGGRTWDLGTRKEYENDLAKVILSTNSSFNFAHDCELRRFTDKWIDGAPHVDRHHISGPVLNRLSDNVVERTRLEIEGRLVTGQCDGWKNKAKTSVIASMITAGSEPHIVRTHDVSAQAKTGEELLKIVKSDILHAQILFLVTVIAWCTDDGGDARKMRRLLAAEWPWLMIILCWAHQLNLVVGDLLATKITLFSCIPQAIEVIKWFNAHSRALGILNKEQADINPNAFVYALILPCITRWTAHFCSLARLELIERSIKAAWTKYPTQLINAAGVRREAKQKAYSIQAIVEDRDFWVNIKHVKRILEPLAIAATILQAPNTRLYTILLTLGNLHRIFSDADIDPQAKAAVLASLRKRWKAADQDLFILSLVLNPYIRNRCFAPGHTELTLSGLATMAKRVCERILRTKCDSTFIAAFLDYLNARGTFSTTHMHLDSFDNGKKTEIDIVQIWEGIDDGTHTGRNTVVKLAIHIQNVVGNSASCERLFSELGLVHTKRRCLLGLNKAEKSSRVRMDLKRQHLAAGIAPKPRKRKLVEMQEVPPASGRESDADAREPDMARQAAVVVNSVDFEEVTAGLVAESEALRALDVVDERDFSAQQPLPSSIGEGNVPINTEPDPPEPPARTDIPLEALFRYPSSSTDIAPWTEWDDWWKGGIESLNQESEVHELLTEEAVGEAQESGTDSRGTGE